MSSNSNQVPRGGTSREVFKRAIRDQLSPGGIATIIATLQPATMQRAPTEDAQRGLDELEWFANTLIEVLGVDEYQRLLEEMCL